MFEFVYFRTGTNYYKTNKKRFKYIQLDFFKYVHISGNGALLSWHDFTTGIWVMQSIFDAGLLALAQRANWAATSVLALLALFSKQACCAGVIHCILGTLTPATADAARKPMQARIKKLTFILTWFILK